MRRDRTASAGSITDPRLRTLAGLWVCVSPLLASAGATLNLIWYWHADSDFGGPPYLTRESEVRTWMIAAMLIALGMLAATFFAAIAHYFAARLPDWIHELSAWTLLAGTYALPSVCLLMYAEDPYDGTGFPGATVLSAILSGIVCSVVILPIAWRLFSLVMR